jgi:hypothetical protein
MDRCAVDFAEQRTNKHVISNISQGFPMQRVVTGVSRHFHQTLNAALSLPARFSRRSAYTVVSLSEKSNIHNQGGHDQPYSKVVSYHLNYSGASFFLIQRVARQV